MHFEIRASRAANKPEAQQQEGDSSEPGTTSYDPKHKEDMPFWRRHVRLMTIAIALVLCLLLTSRVSAYSSRKPPKELFSCINDGQPEQQLTTYNDFAYQKPAR